MERTVLPHIAGVNGNRSFGKPTVDGIRQNFVNRGFPIAQTEWSLAHFRQLLQTYVGHPFKAELNADIELFDYVNGGNCEFCAIGRASKMVRDSALLAKIDRMLNQHDRVTVTLRSRAVTRWPSNRP